MIEKQLAEALVKATSEIIGAAKDATNPHFRSDYATLESVISAVRPSLAKHGLTFMQISHAGESAKIETIIIHESGASLSCGLCEVPVEKKNAQGYGSALTYARRYSLSLSLGVPTIDDDGGASVGEPERPKSEPFLVYMIPDSDLNEKQLAYMNSVATVAGEFKTKDAEPKPGKVWKTKNNLGEKLAKYLNKESSLTELLKANAGR